MLLSHSYCYATGILPTLVVQCKVFLKTNKQTKTRPICTEFELLMLTVSHTETFYVQYNMFSRWFHFLIFFREMKFMFIQFSSGIIWDILSVLCHSFWGDIFMLPSLMCTTEYQRFKRFKDVTVWKLQELLPCSSKKKQGKEVSIR